MRFAVVGSSTLEGIPWILYEFLMDGTRRGTQLFLRRGVKSPPGRFEQLIAELVRQSDHLELRWMLPEPDSGPGAAFDRDNEMVRHSDLVLAFFDAERVMQGGTGHVVESAIDMGVPVYSFALSDIELSRVGEHDPDGRWQAVIGEWFDDPAR